MTQSQTQKDDRKDFLATGTSRSAIIINGALAAIYFFAILFFFKRGDMTMFWILIAGEVFHLWQLFTYLYTVWDTRYMPHFDPTCEPAVDIFVTVCGEPVEIVEQTVRAIKSLDYLSFRVYILNDGYVANKPDWQDIESMAARLGVDCITRKTPGGAKAGNINNGLRLTASPLVAVFDADHVPHRDFLKKTVGYFGDPKMGFVQSPQFYKNHAKNAVTAGAWEQQALFFGAICMGKNRLNAATMCGTNMVIRRSALEEVGGICEESIAEDFVTGMFIHQRGWKSCYVPEVLAEGLAPEDFLSYTKQQFRWARGSLDVLFRYNFLFKRGLSGAQKIQYLSSVSYFLSGFVVLMNAAIPLFFFFFGVTPLQISTMLLAAIFLPYIFLTIYVLQSSTNYSYSFRSLAFSMAGFNIHISAMLAGIMGKKSSFSVTSKKQLSGNFANLVMPHFGYVTLCLVGLAVAITRDGLSASVMSNAAWAILNASVFGQYAAAAMPERAIKAAPSFSRTSRKETARSAVTS
ncbi:MAG: glycosyltransferase [Patescibacteria group bacterium]|nr:glycosyltransferase [Patescibacteria group bacterium]